MPDNESGNLNRTLQCPVCLDPLQGLPDGKEVSEEHQVKALSPIVITESGIVKEMSEEHPEKAPCPIVVTESGIVKEVSEEHL